MLPLMNRNLFKIYLKLLKKPTVGLDTINYISKKRINELLGNDYEVQDIAKNMIKENIQRKTGLNSTLLANIYISYRRTKKVFKSENSVNIVATKKNN